MSHSWQETAYCIWLWIYAVYWTWMVWSCDDYWLSDYENLLTCPSFLVNRLFWSALVRVCGYTRSEFEVRPHWCWLQNNVGNFMIVTVIRCWWRDQYLLSVIFPYWRLFPYEQLVINTFNWSKTSQRCQQHKSFPASLTNIDVTKNLFQLIKIMLALSLND